MHYPEKVIPKSRPATIAAVVALAAVSAGGWALWRARIVLQQSVTEVRRDAAFPFSDRIVTTGAPAGLERIPSAADFTSAAWFQDTLWIASSSALFTLGDGGLRVRYHAGADLPAAPVTAIAVGAAAGQTGEQLFLATAGEGLLLYNGAQFRHIRPDRPEHRKLTALLPLSTGQILLGTEKAGVLAWSGAALGSFHRSLDGLPVTALAGTLDDLWIGTLDRGLFRLHAGQLDTFPAIRDRVLSLAAEGDRVYAGLPTGVAEFRNGAFHRMRAEGAFATAVHTEGDRLDVGTLDQGIFGDAAVTSGAIRQFHRSGETAWAIGGGSVYARSGARGQWKAVAEPQPAMLADHNIAALAVDPSGTAWIGYFDRGMDVLPPSGNAQHIEDEHVFCVNRIVPTSQGAVIATANGLVMADAAGHPRRVLTRNDGLIANHVTDVVVRPEGLIAATSSGITYVTPEGAESIYAFHGLVNNHVYCLGARGNQLFAGTLGGISLLDNRIVGASFTTANSALRANWISALTAVGDEWFAGTYGAGVFRYDGAGWRDFPTLREPFEVNPNAMAATAQAVYAGTLSRGLAVYNRANGRWAFHTAGLPSLNVTAVAAHDGWIWIGTANGLVRLGEGSVALP